MTVKKPIAIVATAALVMTGASFGAAAAQADPGATNFVPLSGIAVPADRPGQTAVYNGWHFDPSHQNVGQTAQARNGLSIAATGNVLLVKGTGNDGENILAEAPSLEDVADDLSIAASSLDGITYQIPVRVDVNENDTWEPGTDKWSTLRTSAATPGVWTTSQAIGGIGAQGTGTFDDFNGITGIYPIAAGFLVQGNSAATVVSSFTSNGETTKFYGQPTSGEAWTGEEYVAASGIADYEDDDTYDSWHNGDTSGLSYETVTGDAWGETLGLQVAGKTQILKGLVNDDVLANLGSLAESMQIDVVEGDVWAQVPIYAYPDGAANKIFTTIRALVPNNGNLAGATEWYSSYDLGPIAKNTPHSLAEILAAAGQHDVIGYGFFVDTGKTATVRSISFNGKTTNFAKPANPVSTENVPVAAIAFDENESSVYNEWHFGPGTGYTTSAAQAETGVMVAAETRTQIIKGNGNDLAVPAVKGSISEFLDSLDIETTGPAEAVTYQIGVRVDVDGDGTWANVPGSWTTLRAEVNAEDGRWTTSKALDGIAANGSATTAEIVAALGENAYVYSAGFLVHNAASAVTVSSFSANGVTTTFNAAPVAPATETTTTLTAPTALVEGDAGQATVTLTPTAPGTLELLQGDEVLETADGDTGTVTADLSELAPGTYELQGKFTPENAALFTGSVSETVTLLVSAKTDPKPDPKPTPTFEDMPAGAKFSKEISWLAQQGITTGVKQAGGSVKFMPKDKVTREAMAAFIYRLAVLKDPAVASFKAPTVSPFADLKPGDKFYKEITWMQSAKLTMGIKQAKGKPHFAPKSAITREAMAAFMYRLDKSAKPATPTSSPFADLNVNDKFFKEMAWMKTSGLSTGIKQTSGKPKYAPKSNTTREATAAFIFRANSLLK